MIGRHVLNMIVCTTKDNLIGDAKPKEGTNGLLWNEPSELRNFKIHTIGQIVVFGTNTAKYVPIELMKKNRHVIILDWGMSLEEELEKIPEQYMMSKVFICGGYSIYKYFLENYDVDCIIKSELSDEVEILPYNEPLYFPNIEEYGFILKGITNKEKFKLCTYLGPNRLNARATLFLRDALIEVSCLNPKYITKFDDYFYEIQKAETPVIVYYGNESHWSIEDENTNRVIIDHQIVENIVEYIKEKEKEVN